MTHLDAEHLVAFLQQQVGIFKDFPPDRLEELVNGSQVSTFEANEAIVKFGEEGWFIGVLIEGVAKVCHTDDSGQTHQLGVLSSGDIFGEMAVMTGEKRMADIIGVDRCKVLLIPLALFSTVLVAHPPAIRFLSRIISERSRQLGTLDGRKELESSALRKSDDPYGLSLRGDKPERLLVICCDESSLKYHLYDTHDERNDIDGRIEGIGKDDASHTWRFRGKTESRRLPGGTHREAFAALTTQVRASVPVGLADVTAVGHRVAHGGEMFDGPALITDAVVSQIRELARFAPHHNPFNLIGIDETRRLFPQVPQVAAFETSFHHTLPPYAYLYGLPYECYERDHVRRYGSHGLSHAYASLKAAQFLKRPYNELEIISCHLDREASICAVEHGRSVDTSMGLTPAEGLISATRHGDSDLAVPLRAMTMGILDHDDLDNLINRQEGLNELSGLSDDMREIEAAAREGNHRALLAFKTFCYRIRKYIGAYMAVMGGLDAIVFTGGIGQGSAGVRGMSCQGLRRMGVIIDEAKNRAAQSLEREYDIAAGESITRVLVIPSDETRMIARETLRTLSSYFIDAIIHQHGKAPIPIEVSAHHVHLCQAHVEALFGPGHRLTPATALSQPGQFTCREQVNLIGPRGRVDRVRVIGPARNLTQVEIAMTE